jgi:hypothetical protein
MDNVLNLKRFDAMKSEVPLPVEKGQMCMFIEPLMEALNKKIKARDFKEIALSACNYGLGLKERKDLKDYDYENAQYVQRLWVDMVDFSNNSAGLEFKDGRWIWPEGEAEKMLLEARKKVEAIDKQ